MNKVKETFIPNNLDDFKKDDIFCYLQNLEFEINQNLFTQNELLLLRDALYGKFLDKSRRSFFLYHFLPLWVNSVQTLFHESANPTVIELGCGTGTSSLLFAMLGAKVIGIEMDADLVGICNKRKEFYERYAGDLKAEFYQANTTRRRSGVLSPLIMKKKWRGRDARLLNWKPIAVFRLLYFEVQ